MFKIKVVIVGPKGAGKTTLANFLSDATESPFAEVYRPTHVVRILEFDTPNLNVNNRNVRAEVELWDTSGDDRFESSWRALVRDAHGLIFVFDPEKESHAIELEVLYKEFVEKMAAVQDSQCVVFAHFRTDNQGRPRKGVKLSSHFNRIPQLEVNIEEEANRLRHDFNTFLSSLLTNLSERSEQEERSILNTM